MVGFGFAEKVLALVVVTEGKTALLRQAQMFREVVQTANDFAEQTLEIDGAATIAELRQMVVFEAQQGSKDGTVNAPGGGAMSVISFPWS